MQSFYYGICASSRLYTLTGPFGETPAARPYVQPFRMLTANELKTLVVSRAWRSGTRQWVEQITCKQCNRPTRCICIGVRSSIVLRTDHQRGVTVGGRSPEGLREQHAGRNALAEQIRNYLVSLALYIKKFPTDAIVAYLKKILPSSRITLDCGPEKIEGGHHYIILAAIAVATGAPQPLCRSLILLKHTQQQASCAFRT